VVELPFIFFTPTFTLLNPHRAGFAVGEIQQGESSPVKGEEMLPMSVVARTLFLVLFLKISFQNQGCRTASIPSLKRGAIEGSALDKGAISQMKLVKVPLFKGGLGGFLRHVFEYRTAEQGTAGPAGSGH
jgi:hypothetical protein